MPVLASGWEWKTCSLGHHSVVLVDHEAVAGNTMVLRILAGEQGGVRGEGGRSHGHVVGEQHGFGGKRIRVGRSDPRIAVATEVIGSGRIE